MTTLFIITSRYCLSNKRYDYMRELVVVCADKVNDDGFVCITIHM